MRHVRWSVAAIDDLASIRDFHSEHDEHAAQRIIDRVVLAADWLLDWPYAGRVLGGDGWRKWTPRHTAYVVIYRPVEDGIEVNSVRHERENWLSDL